MRAAPFISVSPPFRKVAGSSKKARGRYALHWLFVEMFCPEHPRHHSQQRVGMACQDSLILAAAAACDAAAIPILSMDPPSINIYPYSAHACFS